MQIAIHVVEQEVLTMMLMMVDIVTNVMAMELLRFLHIWDSLLMKIMKINRDKSHHVNK